MSEPDDSVDILMITHQRPEYVALSLPRLLETVDARTHVWLWHNGSDEATLKVVKDYVNHPQVSEFFWSKENVGIRAPTNWMWARSQATYISKVDDDCLVSPGWIEHFRSMHRGNALLGVVGSWRFYDEDFNPLTAMSKVRKTASGNRIMLNHWVQGSGYLAKRSLTDQIGLIREGESFPDWCIRAAQAGYFNGWAFPFLHEEHMDDPRSPWTLYRDDAIFQQLLPLSAKQTGVTTVNEWTGQMQRSASVVQSATLDHRSYRGWRLRVSRLRRRLMRLLGYAR
ncbi:glycosyltransferase family 2 protein [Pseudonocardia sp. RS010]|uniref:glycosyltransferase family 2 protein n=1 Tax=Pseudonocardia sp. RS010 TaxID=3385979 RepID=UPI0039A39978